MRGQKESMLFRFLSPYALPRGEGILSCVLPNSQILRTVCYKSVGEGGYDCSCLIRSTDFYCAPLLTRNNSFHATVFVGIRSRTLEAKTAVDPQFTQLSLFLRVSNSLKSRKTNVGRHDQL